MHFSDRSDKNGPCVGRRRSRGQILRLQGGLKPEYSENGVHCRLFLTPKMLRRICLRSVQSGLWIPSLPLFFIPLDEALGNERLAPLNQAAASRTRVPFAT